jgi:YD repeat-containing protein
MFPKRMGMNQNIFPKDSFIKLISFFFVLFLLTNQVQAQIAPPPYSLVSATQYAGGYSYAPLAPQCFENGGTYQNCYTPIATYWTPDNNTWFQDINSASILALTSQPWFTQSSSNIPECFDNSFSCQYVLEQTTPNIGYNGLLIGTNLSDNTSQITIGNTGILETGGTLALGALCNTGDTVVADIDTNNNNILMCAPPQQQLPQLPSQNSDASSDLFDMDGCAESCDPVNFATQAVTDYVVDYQNKSPYPIVWSRRYYEDSTAGHWVFNYDRSVHIRLLTSTTATMTLFRENGEKVYLTGTRANAGSNWTWTLPQVNGASAFIAQVSTDQNLDVITIINNKDETESYNQSGQLTQLQDLNGNTLTFTYSSLGQLIKILDSTGRYLTLSYSNSLQTSSENPASSSSSESSTTVSYYSSMNNVIQDLYPLSVTDGNSTISYGYNVIQLVSGIQNLVGYTSSSLVELTSVTHEDGSIFTYQWNNNVGFWGQSTDELNQVYQNFIQYSTQNGQNPATSSNYLGSSQEQFNYSTLGNTFTVTEPNNFNITGTFNANNQITSMSSPCYLCAVPNDASIVYDNYGNPITLTDFNGNVETRTYDTNRSLVLTDTKASGTPLAQTITYQWDTRFRKPDVITRPVQTPTNPYRGRHINNHLYA